MHFVSMVREHAQPCQVLLGMGPHLAGHFGAPQLSWMDGSLVSPSATALEATGACYKADVSALFHQMLPLEFFQAALREAKVCENNRVYTTAVVVWLMICQRLQAQGTLESAVLGLKSSGQTRLGIVAGAGYAGERSVRVARRTALRLLADTL